VRAENMPKKRIGKYKIVTICEECGKIFPENQKIILIPRGFMLLCYECYVDFKHRKQPNQMHYMREAKTNPKI
jgi:hypothetical protein